MRINKIIIFYSIVCLSCPRIEIIKNYMCVENGVKYFDDIAPWHLTIACISGPSPHIVEEYEYL